VACWIGVDVGGKRKGFDVALIDENRLLALIGGLAVGAVVELVDDERPAVVAIDSPRCCAPTGRAARDGERALARKICGIRWTPDRKTVEGNPYYAWIIEGLELFEALADRQVDLIEVFPTASWTRWFGPRGSRSRATWTEQGAARLGLAGIPRRTNQNQRDAIAAAVTARQHTEGRTEALGEIVVPTSLPTGGDIAETPTATESQISSPVTAGRRRRPPSISTRRRRSSTQFRLAAGLPTKTSPPQVATRTRLRLSEIGYAETGTVSPTSIGSCASMDSSLMAIAGGSRPPGRRGCCS
jgi:predicted nuclease with RNAse H fold